MSLSKIIKSYIIDKKINIPEENWAKIKEEYNKEEVITTLATIISEGYIEMPLAEISLEEALLAEKELSEQEFSIKEGEFYTRYEDSSILSKQARRLHPPSEAKGGDELPPPRFLRSNLCYNLIIQNPRTIFPKKGGAPTWRPES